MTYNGGFHLTAMVLHGENKTSFVKCKMKLKTKFMSPQCPFDNSKTENLSFRRILWSFFHYSVNKRMEMDSLISNFTSSLQTCYRPPVCPIYFVKHASMRFVIFGVVLDPWVRMIDDLGWIDTSFCWGKFYIIWHL